MKPLLYSFFYQPRSSLFRDVLANRAVQVLHRYLGAGVQNAERVIAVSHCHASSPLDAVASGFTLGCDATAPTAAVRPGGSRRHWFPCIAVSDPSYFLQNLLKNG